MIKEKGLRLIKGNSAALVLTNPARPIVSPCTENLFDVLERNGARVYMCDSDKERFRRDDIIYGPLEEIAPLCDIAFVIGGDGTIIRAAKSIIDYNLPILGINAGRLGFLSDIESQDINRIEELFEKEVNVEKRTVIEVKKGRKKFIALNDCYITKSEPGKISELFVQCQGREICRYRADGIIFSTPNGSTAYSMSAGGPVLDTGMEAMIMTPVCPHSLISCSIVFAANKTLDVFAATDVVEKDMDVLCDGECVLTLGKNEMISISKSRKYISFVNLSDRAFYEVLNEKIIGRRE